MMILKNGSRTKWSMAVLAIVLGSSTGCRSTSRWNPTSWFAGREPDASMIAGRNGAPELPTSPSLNHTPTALANNYGATGGGPASTAPTGPAGATVGGIGTNTASTQKGTSVPFGTNPYGGNPYGPASNGISTSNNAASFGNQTTSAVPQSGGLAARSNGFQAGAQPNNGYQTGPYGMSPAQTGANNPVATLPASSSSVVTAPNVNSKPTATFPSPYGGSYGATTPQNTIATASTAASMPGSAPAGGPGLAPSSTSGSAASWSVPEYPSLPATTVSATLGSSNGPTVPASQNVQTGYPAMTSANASQNSVPPAFPQSGSGMPPVTNPVSAVGNFPVNPTLPAPSAYQPAPSSGGYSPGTTGRNTNYNFGTGGTQSSVPPTSPGLPANTATGNSNWLR